MNPYQVVKYFEQALCEYTGAKYAVAVTSCTMALLLAVKYQINKTSAHCFEIPNKTYVSVPMSIINAGGIVQFRNEEWYGSYELKSFYGRQEILDCARLFTSGMYRRKQFQCVSFHWSKTLAIGQGGAILHDNPEADEWFRKARFDGRTQGVEPKNDEIDMIGYHCYMSPRDAAEGLSRLAILPKHNDPLPNSDYPDLSKMSIFQ